MDIIFSTMNSLLVGLLILSVHLCSAHYNSATAYGYQGYQGYQNQKAAFQAPPTPSYPSPAVYSSNPSTQQYLYVLTGKRQVVSSRILPWNTPIPQSLPTPTYNGPLNGPKVTIYRKILRPVRIHYQYWIYPNGQPSVQSQWVGK